MCMFGVARETHAHDYFEVFRFIMAKIYCRTFSNMSLLVYYVICVICNCISKKLKSVKNKAMESKTER